MTASQDSIAQLVSPDGGTLELKGVGSVAFPAGAFRVAQRVALYSTVSAETRRDWEVTGAVVTPGPRLPYELRIVTDTRPAKDCRIGVVIPEWFTAELNSNLEVGLFAQIYQDGGQEILDSFERILPATFDPVTRTINADLPPVAFTDRRRRDRKFEAIIVVSTVLR